MAAPELRVGHHLWRWNIDYFWIFHTANPLSIGTFSIPSELLPSSLTKNKTRIHYNVNIYHAHMAPTGQKNLPRHFSNSLFICSKEVDSSIRLVYSSLIYTLFLPAAPNALLLLLNFINCSFILFPVTRQKVPPFLPFFFSSSLYKVVK